MSLIKQPPFPRRPAGPDEAVLALRDVQIVALELLEVFDAFCQAHRLRYYLCGGTLLGAVRHQGFIPWDDDVDLFMSRPDYDRLVALARTESFGEDVRFACGDNGLLDRPFARLYCLKTQVQRKTRKPCSGAHVWIDILPVDGLPKDPKKLARLFALRKKLDHYNFTAMWIPGTGSRDLAVLKMIPGYILSRLVGAKRWCAIIDRMGRRRPYASSETVGCLTGGRYGAGEAMPRSAFEIPAKVPFEGREYETMSCYREYLTGIYGDYMTPPPVKARRIHMDYVTMLKSDYEALCRRHPDLQSAAGSRA